MSADRAAANKAVRESYRRDNWKRELLRAARTRARNKGRVFSLTVNDLEWPTHCPVLGIELVSGSGTAGKQGGRDNSPSLDRFDNAVGYVPGNVRVISNLANRLKSNATPQQLEDVAAYARGSYTVRRPRLYLTGAVGTVHAGDPATVARRYYEAQLTA